MSLGAAIAASWTAGAVASALALQLAFSVLSVVLPLAFFATVGVPAMLLFGGVTLFGFVLPSLAFALFATGGAAAATPAPSHASSRRSPPPPRSDPTWWMSCCRRSSLSRRTRTRI